MDVVDKQREPESVDSGLYSDMASNYCVDTTDFESSNSNIPKHGCNSMLSSSDSGKHSSSHANQTDSGFGSLTSTTSTDHESTNNDLIHRSAETASVIERKFEDFFMFFRYLVTAHPDPYSWTKSDFSGVLSKSEICKAGETLWKITEGDEDGDFEAINAARDHDEAVVLFSLYMSPDVKTLDTKNLDRQTLLHVAAEMLNARAVRLLVTKGADGAITDLWGNTPLHIASRLGRADVVTALTKKIEREELGHPRYKVPYRSLPQDNKDQINNDGRAPVHLATQGGHTDTVKALAAARVDLDQRRLGDGYAPLHIAIDYGYYDCMKALLECGADLEVRNHKGETPQQLAYLCGRTDMVDLCDKFGASPNQLLFAETEQVPWDSSDYDDSDMDTTDDLADQVEQMSV